MSEKVRDPVLQYCENCGEANDNHSAPAGYAHRCHGCGAFVRTATVEESWLLGKRMEQQILHEQGYVTAGGYTPGAHGPDYESD